MVIASMSYKGGVGKTTVAQNLAVVFAHKGHKVCILDADESQVSMRWSEIRERREISPKIKAIGEVNKDNIIEHIKRLYETYDVIIVDCPPSYQEISTMIMLVSNVVLIPLTPTGRSELWTGKDFLKRYNNIHEYKKDKTPAYFVINKFEPNINFHQSMIEVLETLGEEHGVGVLDTKINKRIAYGEVNAQGLGVYEYSNRKAKEEIISLVNEILAKNQ